MQTTSHPTTHIAAPSAAPREAHQSTNVQGHQNGSHTLLNDRYADSIIGDRAEDYDALEIQGVRDLNEERDPTGTQCEVDNDNPQFISVYVHVKCDKGGGVECVGDFGTHALAVEYANELAERFHWPIHDFSPFGKWS